MKHLLYLFSLLLFFSCTRVLDNPITIIKNKPIKVDSVDYPKLIDSLKIEDIYKVPDFYGGLTPRYEMAMVFTEYEKEDDVLFGAEGMSITGRNLLIKKDNNYIQIRSRKDLKKFFTPIDSEEEALSYVAISTDTEVKYDIEIKSRYRTFVDEINKSYAKNVDSGYETNTFDYDLFGCGPHSHYMVKCFVDYQGNVKEIERVKIYEDPKEDGLCID